MRRSTGPLRPIVTAVRDRSGPAAARVFEQLRSGGAMAREEIAATTGLSPATAGRTVAVLLERGVLRERPDLVREGVVGRPSIPVGIDTDRYLVIGITLGRAVDTVALGDLTGQVLTHTALRRRPGHEPDLAALSRAAAELQGRLPGREPVAVGLVAPWPALGLDPNAVVVEMEDLTGLPVRRSDRVAALAGADYLRRRSTDTSRGHLLYVYGGDGFGYSAVMDRGDHIDVFRGASLDHFPIGSDATCGCGRTGCLDATLGERALAQGLYDDGLVSRPDIAAVYAAADDPDVLARLRERSRVLGRVVAAVRDMLIVPDAIVLVGSTFTEWPDATSELVAAYTLGEPFGPVPLEFSRLGSADAVGACAVGLGPVLDDPLAVIPTPPPASPAAGRHHTACP